MRACAWLVSIDRSGVSKATGDQVESSASFISEGAWSGRFSAIGLLESNFVCGSGAVLDGDVLRVVAPSHCVEGVYCFLGSNFALVSNSIHAIIAARKDAYPVNYDAARQESKSAKLGTRLYGRTLYSTSSGQMLRFLYGGFSLHLSDFTILERTRPSLGVRFVTFEEYRSALLTTLERIVANGSSPERKHPYTQIVTTCSAGYDSAACAVLARKLGATKALTISSGRRGNVDSGRPIAEKLGLECLEFERVGVGQEFMGKGGEVCLDANRLPEGYDDFLATFNSSEDLFMAPMEPHLRRAILLTGFHGDKAWHRQVLTGAEIKRGDNSGSGLDVFRTRVGFVNIPVPFIGVENFQDLKEITAQPEMQAYHIGGPYDRPLPRRIVEEAGVPRTAFGIQKSAGSVILSNSVKRRQKAFNELIDEYRNTRVTAVPMNAEGSEYIDVAGTEGPSKHWLGRALTAMTGKTKRSGQPTSRV